MKSGIHQHDGEDTTVTTGQSYLEQSLVYLAQASEEFAREEMGQASGMAWGAAATIVKAVAEERGWAHEGHRELFRAVNHLADETRDANLRMQFHVASGLQTNFYEGWLERVNVKESLEQVAQFVEKLEALLASR